METPRKYIFSESEGVEEYDNMLTWSEELNMPGIWGYFSPSLLNEIAYTKIWDHSLYRLPKGWSKTPCLRFFIFRFVLKLLIDLWRWRTILSTPKKASRDLPWYDTSRDTNKKYEPEKHSGSQVFAHCPWPPLLTHLLQVQLYQCVVVPQPCLLSLFRLHPSALLIGKYMSQFYPILVPRLFSLPHPLFSLPSWGVG